MYGIFERQCRGLYPILYIISCIIVIFLCFLLIIALIANLFIFQYYYYVLDQNVYEMNNMQQIAEFKYIFILFSFEIYFVLIPLLRSYDRFGIFTCLAYLSWNDYRCRYCKSKLTKIVAQHYYEMTENILASCNTCTLTIDANEYLFYCQCDKNDDSLHENGKEICFNCVVKLWDDQHRFAILYQYISTFLNFVDFFSCKNLLHAKIAV